MFGIMDQNTGKCWPSVGLWYKDNLHQYTYRAVNMHLVAVPKAYINTRIVKLQDDAEYHKVK